MKIFLVLALCICISVNAFSQSEFRPGYYVTVTNDTVRGLLDYRGDTFNSFNCRYKSDSAADVKEFNPGQISGYRFTDSRYYVTKTITVEQNDTTLFVECLLKGKITLYFLTFKNRNYYFIEVEAGELKLLHNNDIRYTGEDGTIYEKESKQYIGVLTYYLQDHPDLLQQINNLPYDKKSVIRISKEFHEKICKPGEACVIYEKNAVKNRFDFGLVAGTGFYKTEYGIVYAQLKRIEGIASSVGLGIETQFQMSDQNERTFFINRLMYNHIKWEGSDRLWRGSAIHTATISNLKLNIGLKYAAPKSRFSPIVTVGVFGETLSFNNYKSRYESGGRLQFPEEWKINNLKTYGLFLGTGFQIQNNVKFTVSYDRNLIRFGSQYFFKRGVEFTLGVYL